MLVAPHLCDDLRRTKHEAPIDCNDLSPGAMFVDLGITQCRGHHLTRVVAWSTWAAPSRWRCRRTVIGQECVAIRRPLVTRQSWWSTIGAGLKGGQECGGLLLAALMGAMIDATPMTGQSHRLPAPGITESPGVVRLQGLLFFFMKVQSASLGLALHAHHECNLCSQQPPADRPGPTSGGPCAVYKA